MSSKLHGYVWDGCAASGMKTSSVAIMARLADFSSDEGVCWPSIETIARQTGLGISTTRTAIAQLEREGWLKRRQRRQGNRNASNVYQLNVAKLFAAAQPNQPNHDPSKSDPSEFERSEFDPSKSSKKTGFHPSESGGDPSVNSNTDPSLNPTHNACEGVVEPESKNPIPEYAGQPGVFFPASQMIGKFPMSNDWTPSPDFRPRAAYWGHPVPESMDRKALMAALASFTDYWISEQKVFSQTQWEQKLARHLQNARPTPPRGNNHAGLDPNSTANPAVQKIRAARAQLERERAERLGVLGASGGNLLEPVDGQKRLKPVGPMDCADWEFDQRPDDERL